MCEGEGDGGGLKGMTCILLGMGGECSDSHLFSMYVRLCIMSR